MKRKYTGKFPNRVRTVSAKDERCTVITNAGAILRFDGVNGARELGFRLPKLGDDMTGHLLARGVATRAGLEQRANVERDALIRNGARRFAVGDVAQYQSGNECERVTVGDLSHGGGNYVTFTDGSSAPALSRNLSPAFPWVVSTSALRSHGVKASWTIQAREMLELLGVSKLPAHALPVRWIQGHAVYVISAQEARDVGEFHRVRVICEKCWAHVPFGRMHQHKCSAQ